MAVARFRSRRGWVGVTAAGVVGVCGVAESTRADEVRVVARAGQTIQTSQGTMQIVRFGGPTTLIAPTVGPSGHIVFDTIVSGANVSGNTNHALWRAGPTNGSALELIGRKGQAAGELTGTGAIWSWFDYPIINRAGAVAFYGTMSGVPSGTGLALWRYDDAQLAPVVLARSGQDSALLSGTDYISTMTEVSFARQATAGPLSFKSTLGGPGATTASNKAVWVSTDHPVPLFRVGEASNQLGGAIVNDVSQVASDGGPIAIYASLRGTGVYAVASGSQRRNDQVIIRPNGFGPFVPTMTVVARNGTAANDTNGRYFSQMFSASSRPSVNGQGSVAFSSSLVDSANVTAGSGVWTNRSGILAGIAITGDQAPGMPSGVTYSQLFQPVAFDSVAIADDAGRSVVYYGLVAGPGVTSSNNRALWRHSATGGATLLCRGGQAVPEAGPGVTLTSISIGPVKMNRAGDIAFFGTLFGDSVSGTNDRALFSTVGGALRMIAREGQVMPGANGAVISELRNSDYLWINGTGQIAFYAMLADPASPGTILDSLARVDQNGMLHVVMMPDRTVATQTGTVVRYGTLTFNGRLGQGILSDNGDIVFISELSYNGATGGGGSAIVNVRIAPLVTCAADYNRSGVISVEDIFEFLRFYFAANADFNHDGVTSPQDIYDFLSAFYSGC